MKYIRLYEGFLGDNIEVVMNLFQDVIDEFGVKELPKQSPLNDTYYYRILEEGDKVILYIAELSPTYGGKYSEQINDKFKNSISSFISTLNSMGYEVQKYTSKILPTAYTKPYTFRPVFAMYREVLRVNKYNLLPI